MDETTIEATPEATPETPTEGTPSVEVVEPTPEEINV